MKGACLTKRKQIFVLHLSKSLGFSLSIGKHCKDASFRAVDSDGSCPIHAAVDTAEKIVMASTMVHGCVKLLVMGILVLKCKYVSWMYRYCQAPDIERKCSLYHVY